MPARLLVGVLAVGSAGGWGMRPALGEEKLPGPPPYEAAYGELLPFGLGPSRLEHETAAVAARRFDGIQAALAWLAAHQTPAGLWQPHELGWCRGRNDPLTAPTGPGMAVHATGLTGMALSCFLAAGYGPAGDHPFADTVARGIAALLAVQDAEGCFGPRNHMQYGYGHAFAVVAVLEAASLGGSSAVWAACRKGLSFSALARNPYLGWRYGITPGDNDTSATCSMAMGYLLADRINQAAADRGWFAPLAVGEEVREGVRQWLDKVRDGTSGRTGYQSRGTGPARTAAMTDRFPGSKSEAMTAADLAMRLLFLGESAATDAGLSGRQMGLMDGLTPSWNPLDGSIDLYYWYYGAHAAAAMGSAGTRWLRLLGDVLLGAQLKSGDVCTTLGSWDPIDPWSEEGGRIYSTAIATLTLLAPHRAERMPADRADIVALLGARDVPNALRSPLLAAAAHVPHGRMGAAVRPLLDAQGSAALGEGDAIAAASAVVAAGSNDAKATALLWQACASQDETRRKAALRGLAGASGAKGAFLAALLAAVDGDNKEVQQAAVAALARSNEPAAQDRLAALVRGEDALLRLQAALGLLGAKGGEALRGEAATVVGAAVAKADASQRLVLLHALALAGPVAAPAASSLAETLSSPVGAEAALAAAAMLSFKPDHAVAVSIAGRAVGSGRANEVAVGLFALERAGAAAYPASRDLGRVLLDGRAADRERAAQLLALFGDRAAPALPALAWVEAFGAEPWRTRAAKLKAKWPTAVAFASDACLPLLGSDHGQERAGAVVALRPHAAALVRPLGRIVDDPATNGKIAALELLASAGPAAGEVLGSIGLAFEHNDPNVKAAAATALGTLGPRAAAHAAALEAGLDAKWDALRLACARALCAVDPPRALVALREGIAAEDRSLRARRMACLGAVGHLGEGALPLVPQLVAIAAAQTEDRAIPTAATTALASIGSPMLPGLLVMLRDGSSSDFWVACRVIGSMGPSALSTCEALLEAAEKPSRHPHAEVIGEAIGAIGVDALPELRKALKSKSQPVRYIAAEQIGALGAAAKPALSALRTMSKKDVDERVRSTAAKAVEHIEAALQAK